jgi:two-component system cell cycle response regulator
MSRLVHAALTLRKTVRASLGFVLAGVFLLLPVLGVFRPEVLGVEHVVIGLAWAGLLASRASKRSARVQAETDAARRDALWRDLEIGLELLAGTHAAVQMFGGLEGPLYPLVYVLVAFFASFAVRPAGSILVLTAIAYELVLWLTMPPTGLVRSSGADTILSAVFDGTPVGIDAHRAALHGVFILFFGILNLLFTRAEIARVRERSNKERIAEKQRIADDVKLFRLVGAPSVGVDSAHRGPITQAAEGEHDEKAHRASIDEVRSSLFHVLELLKRTLELHTCVLLFTGADGRLRIVELVTDSDDVADGPFEAGAGAVGAVATRGLTMNLEHLKPGYKGLCYYRGPSTVSAFLGVPVSEGGQLRGALCVDRIEDRPFSPREEAVLQHAVVEALRAIRNERVFVQLERTKREQTMLFRASRELGAALTEEHVIEAGLSAASGLARYDFAAITAYDEAKGAHRVIVAVGDSAEVARGLAFKDNTSLTAMVVKNKHYLPYRGEYDARQQTLFTAKAALPDMRSVLVLPLVVREEVLGTLVVATKRAHAYGDSVRPTLEVLSNQLAISLSNARAVKRLEEMATTDGLTGCLNKRTFLTDLESKIRSAARFKKKLSLIVTDIDHFKNVNDTYGHATGDVVIKELGAILTRMKRETDRVARFGGEEFCVLCEETDTDGAMLLAERIRDELGKTVFTTELGKLKVTASLGVATFPRDANDEKGLFEITDKALYAAKHGGRNRVCTVKDLGHAAA